MILSGAYFPSEEIIGFGIPLYSEDNKWYHHITDEGGSITGFQAIDIPEETASSIILESFDRSEEGYFSNDITARIGDIGPSVLGTQKSLAIIASHHERKNCSLLHQALIRLVNLDNFSLNSAYLLTEDIKDSQIKLTILHILGARCKTTTTPFLDGIKDKIHSAIEKSLPQKRDNHWEKFAKIFISYSSAVKQIQTRSAELYCTYSVIDDAHSIKRLHPDIEETSILRFRITGNSTIPTPTTDDNRLPTAELLAGTPFEILSQLEKTEWSLKNVQRWLNSGPRARFEHFNQSALLSLCEACSLRPMYLTSVINDFVYSTDGLKTLYHFMPDLNRTDNPIRDIIKSYARIKLGTNLSDQITRNRAKYWHTLSNSINDHHSGLIGERVRFYQLVTSRDSTQENHLNYLAFGAIQNMMFGSHTEIDETLPIALDLDCRTRYEDESLYHLDTYSDFIQSDRNEIYIDPATPGETFIFDMDWDRFETKLAEAQSRVISASRSITDQILTEAPDMEYLMSPLLP